MAKQDNTHHHNIPMRDSFFIGFDIGGTNTRAILWKNGKILKDIAMPTGKTVATFKKNIKNSLKQIDVPGEPFAVGIGVAGIVKGTSLVYAPNIPKVRNFDFKKMFGPKVRVLVDNDARCFLRHDMSTRNETKTGKTFAFTIGTGFGRAFSENRKVRRIKKFEKPEPWEPEYQKIRDSRNYRKIADYLSGKMMPFIKKYKPATIFFGGGLSRQKAFFEKLRSNLRKKGVAATMMQSRDVHHAGSVGAILNYFY